MNGGGELRRSGAAGHPVTQRRAGQEQDWKAISQDDRPTSGILSLEGDAVVNVKEQLRPSESN